MFTYELLVSFGIDLLRGSTIILCAVFQQYNNRWRNIGFLSGSSACFMRMPMGAGVMGGSTTTGICNIELFFQ